MTCVVGIVARDGTVVLAADSLGTDWHVQGRVSSKVYEVAVSQPRAGCVERAAIGFTTSYRFGQIAAHAWLPRLLDDGVRPGMSESWLARVGVEKLRAALREHGWLRRKDEREESGTLMLGLAGQLWTIGDDFSVAERSAAAWPAFWAIGIGREYALGCLHGREPELELSSGTGRVVAGEATIAVQAAIKYSPGCGGNVDIVYAPPPG